MIIDDNRDKGYYRPYILISLLILTFCFTVVWVYDGLSSTFNLNYQSYTTFLEVINQILITTLGN